MDRPRAGLSVIPSLLGEDLDLYEVIRHTATHITDLLRDMDTLPLEEHCRTRLAQLSDALSER